MLHATMSHEVAACFPPSTRPHYRYSKTLPPPFPTGAESTPSPSHALPGVQCSPVQRHPALRPQGMHAAAGIEGRLTTGEGVAGGWMVHPNRGPSQHV